MLRGATTKSFNVPEKLLNNRSLKVDVENEERVKQKKKEKRKEN